MHMVRTGIPTTQVSQKGTDQSQAQAWTKQGGVEDLSVTLKRSALIEEHLSKPGEKYF